ncbi:MAG: tRNA (adenosine(37)-N6)-dimethylallyltransferase MiaA [Lachnospiraceae bacterium]|nr:tRNA (adenosine(37)-N6)-dimethylallyltransferase MiaA [Lachnospiraceae bacterium]
MQENEQKPLIVLTGPTAAGKTKLSIALARAVGGEILSADSMQVYRGMDIGTAKITAQEMEGIPHHLIDILPPKEEFNVVRFQALAREAMEGIYARGKIPVIVGGTGFYIQAVTNAVDFTESDTDTALREELFAYAQEHGAAALHKRLAAVDPQAAAQIHENNIKRTIRALEYHAQTGGRISEHNEEQAGHISPYELYYFVLTAPRDILYENINRRVDEMMAMGLPAEVARLKEEGCTRGMVSMQGLGYKELFAYLDGELTLKEATEQIKRNTRHFAKRQLTWFKREKQVIWVDKAEYGFDEEKILAAVLEHLPERLRRY